MSVRTPNRHNHQIISLPKRQITQMSMLPRLQNEIFILLPHLPHTYLEEIGPNGAPRRNEIESLCIF
jgi:hypothetical protein